MQESPEALWASVSPGRRIFRHDDVESLPDFARRYLTHAIESAAPLPAAVRLRMHGEIKLRGWTPFTAEEVITSEYAMIWRAKAKVGGLPITGSDRFLGGVGAMRWKALGIVPVMAAAGPDITRSAAGRVMAESVWLPSVFCRDDARWTERGAHLRVGDEAGEIRLSVDQQGRLVSLKTSRWGNPGGGPFAYVDFGGVALEERAFGAYTIPTRLRIGYFFGDSRFDSDGEFFRVTIDDAEFR